MLNYWWVTRPKRKLNSIPEILGIFAELSLNQEWKGQRDSHLSFEDTLELNGLKREGDRRDQTGGGGRTYKAWVESLGLIFTQAGTNMIKLTLAGEAIMNGKSPVLVLKNQILKYQFPSPYSLSRSVQVSRRFKIRPFLFLLKLLNDSRIKWLSQEEIAKIIIVEAENETDEHYEYIVRRIHDFRNFGDSCLESDFSLKYKSSKGSPNLEKPYAHLLDISNTIINWLEYTQLINRENQQITIFSEKRNEVNDILSHIPSFINRPDEPEYFQRKYGLDPWHQKDTRNLTGTRSITPAIIAEQLIKQAYINESLLTPITKITSQLIDKIAAQTGLKTSIIEETLLRLYPNGSVGSFMTKYFEMAFSGRDEAIEFETATAELFKNIFNFKAIHVGPVGKTPDVLIISDSDEYQAIIDNKAYRKYTISNDHHNRMVHNYIKGISTYGQKNVPLAFFTYIAGGFGSGIDQQIKNIYQETKIKGSAINVLNMIKLVETNSHCCHSKIKDIFSVNRQIMLSDLQFID